MRIRHETPADFAAIRAINVAAFLHHPFSHQTEHLIVEALREAGALSVSLVAEEEPPNNADAAGHAFNGKPRVVGHVAFSHAFINGAVCGWFMAGPLAVLPDRQKCGIGGALVKDGLDAIRGLGACGCVLVGDPAFYTRFGFKHDDALTMDGVPPEVVLALPFTDDAPRGEVTHHEAFLVTA